MQRYFDNLSAIATISSLTMPEIFPACVPCSNIFILSQISLAFSCGKIVEIPEAMIAGD